jgi:hypothetical protein
MNRAGNRFAVRFPALLTGRTWSCTASTGQFRSTVTL